MSIDLTTLKRHMLAVLAAGGLLLVHGATAVADDAGAAGQAPLRFSLTTSSSSFLLADQSPTQDVSLYFGLRYEQPGRLLDTVGVNSAVPGAWMLDLLPDGRMQFSLYAPGVTTAFADGNGWHRYALPQPLVAGAEYWVTIDIIDYELLMLAIDSNNKEIHLLQNLPGGLANIPVFVGDFPGDDQWGNNYNIHPAAIAELRAYYYGAYIEEFSEVQRAQSLLVKPLPGPGSGTDDVRVTPEDHTRGKDQPGSGIDQPGSQGQTAGSYPPADTPAAAVEYFLQAQVAKDLERAFHYVALDLFPKDDQATARQLFDVVAARSQMSNFFYRALATAYTREKDFAIVRGVSSMTVQAGADIVTEPCGSLALLRHSDAGWKVIQISADDLLNTELECKKLQARRPQSGLILAATSTTQQALAGRLIELSELSELMTERLNRFILDKTKIGIDSGFAWAGAIPVIGPYIATGYTSVQWIKTLFTEVLPDIWEGDWEMVGLGAMQLTVGGIQIAVHIGESTLGGMPTGVGIAVDHVGSAMDTFKDSVEQARNQSIIRESVNEAGATAPQKFLFLHYRKIYYDKDHGFESPNQLNVRFEYYEDWRFEPAPLKKIIIESDIPVRFWKTLDFDVGYYFKIKKSKSEVLFDVGRKAGYPVHTISGADYEVLIPLRMNTASPKGPLVSGELTWDELSSNRGATAIPVLDSRGAPILAQGKIVDEVISSRYLQFQITPTPGPNQVLRVQLNDAAGSLTMPVEIENAVYNAVSTVVPEANLAQTDAKKRRKLNLAMGTTTEVQVLGEVVGYPPPRIIGAPDSNWSLEHDAGVVKLEIVGAFPDALLRLTGLKPGTASIQCWIPTATIKNGAVVGSSHYLEMLDVEVIAAEWMLVDTIIEPSSERYKATNSVKDGSVYSQAECSHLFAGNPEAWVKGIATWNSPPKAIPDKGGIWELQCNLTREAKNPAGGFDLTEMNGLNTTLCLTDQRGSFSNPGKQWHATKDAPTNAVVESIKLDEWCKPETDASGRSLTGRRIICLELWMPGISASIKYIYATPDKVGSGK